MTEIQPYTPPTTDLAEIDSWVPVLESVADLSRKIADTDFVPSAYRGNTAAIAATVLYGRELGLPPMTALAAVDPIKGTPSLSAEAMRALIFAAGHDLRFVESTATRCIIEGRRKGQESWTRVAYTMDEAKTSGDAAKNQQYRTRPAEMLVARCTTRIGRMMFPECLGGFPSPEEVMAMGDSAPQSFPATVTVTAPAMEAPKPEPKPKPARKKATPKPTTPPQPAPALDGPPLPGEDGFEDMVPEPQAAPEPEIVDAEIVEGEPPAEPLRSDAQSKKLFALLRELDINQRDQGLEMIGSILGREVESTKTLTKTEASKVIESLASMTASEPPAENLSF